LPAFVIASKLLLAAKRVSGVEFKPWRMEFVEDVVLPSGVLGPEDFCALIWLARSRAAEAMVFGVLDEGGGEAIPGQQCRGWGKGWRMRFWVKWLSAGEKNV